MSNLGRGPRLERSTMPGPDDARADLPAGEAKFRALANAAPVMIWVSDASGACTFFNEPWLRFVGKPMEGEIGDGWAASVHPDDATRCSDLYGKAFEKRRPFTREYRMQRHDGEYRWILDNGAPWYEPDGEFGGYIGSCIDVSERKEMEEELQRRVEERTEELTQAYKEMESFSYSVSHDLRAPLRSISSNLSFLVEDFGGDLNPEALEYVNRAKSGAARMDTLMQGILQLSRLSRKPLVTTTVDLSALSEKAAKEEGGEDKTFEVQGGMLVEGDQELLGAVLHNLIGNAYKYGATHVAVGKKRNAYFVKDNGIGFDPQFTDKIFLPFERLHSPTDYPGTGLGLSTAKRIVDRHGGKMWAESTPGQGSTFFFTVGKQPAEAMVAAS
jgi:PAS domain S-box-containing protein